MKVSIVATVLLLCFTTLVLAADEDKLPSAILSPDETEVVTFNVDANGNQTTLQLNCSGEGTLSWFRGEPPNADDLSEYTTLLEDNLLMLTISPVQNNTDASSEGIPYYCVANNTLGRARSRTVLVKYAFFDGFKAENTTTIVDIRMGQAMAIECGVVGAAPPPDYIWFKGNMTLDTTSNTNKIRTLDDGATLVIYDLTNDDISEDYTCGVTNARMFDTEISTRKFSLFNNASLLPTTMDFVVYRPPKSVTVTTTTLAAGIRFYYIGATNGANTRIFASTGLTADDATLSASIDTVPTADLFMFLVNVNTQIAASERSFDITVIEPLVVTERPSNISTIYHRFTTESINFTCNASGTGTKLQWFKNTKQIDVEGSTLVFDQVSVSDAGVYQCFWEESDDGTFALDTWALMVQEPVPPNSFVFNSNIEPSVPNPNRTIVPQNEAVVLTLQFRADDVISLTWFRNDTETGIVTEIDFSNPLYNTTGFNRIDDNNDWFRVVFTIVRVNNLTSGYYYAEIDDGRTPPITSPIWFVSEEVQLQIVSFTLSPHNCLLEGADNLIQCIVRGLPDPTVTFEKSSSEIVCPINGSCTLTSDLEGGTVTNAELSFNSVTSADKGLYSCHAMNMGSNMNENEIDESLFGGEQVEFCTSPEITGDFVMNRNVDEGDDITLQCRVESTPLPTAAWYQDGVELRDIPGKIEIEVIDINGLSELTLRNVSVNNSGLYTCSFNNTHIPRVVNRTMNITVTVEIPTTEEATTTTLPVWVPVAAGVGAGLALLLIVAVILVVCLCCCLVRSNRKKGSYTTGGVSMHDYTDGRGNVDKDSDEEEEHESKHPEAFQPQYESLPVVRPAVPPDYKPSPAYGGDQFAPQNDDFEIMKPPIPDDNQGGSYQYNPQQFFQGDNGGMAIHGSMMQGLHAQNNPRMGSSMGIQQQHGRFEDFASDDEKFV